MVPTSLACGILECFGVSLAMSNEAQLRQLQEFQLLGAKYFEIRDREVAALLDGAAKPRNVASYGCVVLSTG